MKRDIFDQITEKISQPWRAQMQELPLGRVGLLVASSLAPRALRWGWSMTRRHPLWALASVGVLSYWALQNRPVSLTERSRAVH